MNPIALSQFASVQRRTHSPQRMHFFWGNGVFILNRDKFALYSLAKDNILPLTSFPERTAANSIMVFLILAILGVLVFTFNPSSTE
jgi:hypothetical protein